MKFLRLTDLDLKNKRVFIRADLNVPQDDTGNITDDTRIRASVPGIAFALKAGAALGVGIDHENYRAQAEPLLDAVRDSLVADLD